MSQQALQGMSSKKKQKDAYPDTDEQDCDFSISQSAQPESTVEKEKVMASESEHAFYKKYLTPQNIKYIVDVVNILKQEGINAEPSKFRQDFQRSCIKTDWQSAVYDCRIGPFRYNLSIIKLNIDAHHFFKEKIGSGQYGEIFEWEYERKKYVVKNISTFESEQIIDSVLREVLFLKICSVLKVGPQFHNLFGYDVVVFRDSVQFAMEKCETGNLHRFHRPESPCQRLLSALSLLHSLGICHQDIKLENVGWSSNFNHFVFLDFGFASCVREPLGYKTRTKFVGTYDYVSPQMKRLYFVKEANYVDLYYNDLYCLLKVLKQITTSKKIMSQKIRFVIKNIQLQEAAQDLYETKSLCTFLQLKSQLFHSKVDAKTIKMFNQEEVLLETFKKIIHEQLEKELQPSFRQKILELKEIINLKIEAVHSKDIKMSQMDALFCNYLFQQKIEAKGKLLGSFQRLLQTVNNEEISDKFIKKILQNQMQMSHLFYFLDVYSHNQINIQSERKKIIIKFSNFLYPNERGEDMAIKFRKLLLYFFEYFKKKPNIKILEQIQGYFVLMDDNFHQHSMEEQILSAYLGEAQKSFIPYVNKNFHYFFSKIMLGNKIDFYFKSSNQQKLKDFQSQIQCRSGYILQYHQNSFLKNSIKLLEILRQKKVEGINLSQSDYSDACEKFLSCYSRLLDHDNILLIKYFLVQEKISGEFLQMGFLWMNNKVETPFLKNCLMKCNIHESIINMRPDKLLHILKTEKYCSEFYTIYHCYVQNLSKKIKRSICLNEIKILQKHWFNVSQLHLIVLIKNLEKDEIFKMLEMYIYNLSEASYEKQQDKMYLCVAIYRILTCLSEQRLAEKLDENLQDIIEKIQAIVVKIEKSASYSVLENTFKRLYDGIQADYTLENLVGKIQIEVKQFGYYLYMNRSLLHLIKGNFEQEMHMLINVMETTGEVVPISELCKIYHKVQPEARIHINKSLQKFIMRLVQGNKIHLLISLNKILFINIEYCIDDIGIQETVSILLQLCECICVNKVSFVASYLLEVFQKFSLKCGAEARTALIRDFLDHKIQTSWKTQYMITILIFQLYLHNKRCLSIYLVDRILKKCVCFVGLLNESLLRSYKNSLLSNCLNFVRKQYRIITKRSTKNKKTHDTIVYLHKYPYMLDTYRESEASAWRKLVQKSREFNDFVQDVGRSSEFAMDEA